MTPQPIPGTLLAAFQRFADLSCYWHRAHTPDSLAIAELQERQRLLMDIPELIKRLTAFSELGTDAMFAAYAKAKAAPPRDNAGQGWRMLEEGETIQKGDEWRTHSDDQWRPVIICQGDTVRRNDFMFRRIAKEHIRADFEPREALGGKESQETASADDVIRCALEGLAQFHDKAAEAHLAATGSYAAFDEPYAAELARKALQRADDIRRRVTPPTPATEPPQP